MINIMGRAAVRGLVMAALMSVVAAPAVAQGPSEAQREAIKADCRNDYIAHCSSIPPGGEASVQCLAKSMSSLSPSCQAAVRAVEAPAAAAAPAPATAPAAPSAKPAAPTTAPKAAATTPAKQPSSAQVAAVRSACQSDYPKSLRGRVTRRRSGAAMPGEEQGKSLGELPAGRQRRHWRCGAGGRRGTGDCCCARCRGAADHAGAAKNAAARGAFRGAVGMCRGHWHPLPGRRARRRPYHAVSVGSLRFAVARVQGCPDAIRRAVALRT